MNNSGKYARQAIETYFIGPSNRRGSRIAAQSFGKRRYYSCPLELNLEDLHIYAATQLAAELGWNNANWYTGVLRNGHYVHVDASDYRR